jgi:acyl-CoA synthetase (AMP-forming)/AMP-acid ligase II
MQQHGLLAGGSNSVWQADITCILFTSHTSKLLQGCMPLITTHWSLAHNPCFDCIVCSPLLPLPLVCNIPQEGDVSVLMAVPTMYNYLLSHYESHMTPEEQQAARSAAAALRLTVSGSAAAPVPLLHRWQALSGQRLLERYGMTETGMILSNPYEVGAVTHAYGCRQAYTAYKCIVCCDMLQIRSEKTVCALAVPKNGNNLMNSLASSQSKKQQLQQLCRDRGGTHCIQQVIAI